MPVLVEVRGVSKRYPLVSRQGARLRSVIDLLMSRMPRDGVCVLEPLDLEIRRGESVAIIGENGAGKSTLLKLITGVLRPSTGSVVTHGSIGALLELGAGFHPEFSGRENLRMSAALAGLTQKEIRERMPEIIDFADIGRYIDEPIKHYSSGMVVRLGFAIVAALRPDLLITDEVLAVGDESFQRKCIAWIERYLKQGGTLLLVSHGMYHVQKLCQHALWLHQGRLVRQGDVFEVSQAYLAHHEQRSRHGEQPGIDSVSSECRVRRIVVNEQIDPRKLVIDAEGKLRATIDLCSSESRAPKVAVGLVHANGMPIYGIASDMEDIEPSLVGEGEYRFEIEMDVSALLPGEYLFRVHPLDGAGVRLFGTCEIELVVVGKTRELGVVRIPHWWSGSA